MSVDRDLILKTIYEPIFPGLRAAAVRPVGADGRQVVRQHQFADIYDPAGAEKLLTDNGWTKGSDGFWADGRQRADHPLDGQHRQQAP